MKRGVELFAAAVVGAVVSVFITQAADATGFVAFTIIVVGGFVASALAIALRRVLARRRRAAERLDRIERSLVERERDQLELMQRTDRAAHDIRERLHETTLQALWTWQLVVPDWLRAAEAWARENGWTVSYDEGAITFARDGQPQHTAVIIMPLGSHQEEEATRTVLLKHLGHPEQRRTFAAQLGSMTRVLGRGG